MCLCVCAYMYAIQYVCVCMCDINVSHKDDDAVFGIVKYVTNSCHSDGSRKCARIHPSQSLNYLGLLFSLASPFPSLFTPHQVVFFKC